MKVNPEEIARKFKEFSRRIGKNLSGRKEKLKERYTITGDIISYSICPRQYGLYKFYGFAPSNPTQEWYGSVIHRFLKRAHTIYKIEKRLISEEDVEEIFRKVENSMEAEGIRASSPQVRETVIALLKEFCRLMGGELIPKIEEAELRLVKEMPHFILYGIVDALKLEDGDFEIWDYKGMRRPDPGSEKLEIYKKQLFVYGYLFKERNGSYPKRGVLLFMNELLGRGSDLDKRTRALYFVDFTDPKVVARVEEFIEDFSKIVSKIEESKVSGRWELPDRIDEKTCLQCDFRFDCPKFPL